jgi:acyl-homoserine lactone acylase PvdQ
MKRVLVASCSALTLLALSTASPAATADLESYTANGQVLNILPPGSSGNVDAQKLLTLGVTNLPTSLAAGQPPSTVATGTTPTNFADQLEMYDALGKVAPGTLKDSDLTTYYKNARLGIADADVVSTETPRPGVTIKRDKYGVPHIKGATDADVAFGSGYANIEDRMFLTDVLRHTGSANLAAFVGPTPGNIAMDASQLRIAAYTPAQAQAQIDDAVKRYPVEGAKLVAQLDAMIAGMNAAQSALCPLSVPVPIPGITGLGFGQHCPVEYAALQKPPTPYTRADIVYIASLVGGIFGKGGGGEEDNARWLQLLQNKFGVAQGRKVFDDLREKNDPEAPASSPTTQAYGGGPVRPQAGNALPDLTPTATAPGTGSDAGGSTLPIPLPFTGTTVDGPFGKIALNLKSHGMSNALLVDAKHSADGHPTVVFGPQTGYYTPQLLVEQDLDGPTIKARGVSFAGTNLVVELGHGVDYAWSATSASSDIVDTIAERLCNADGSAATVNSTSYLVGSTCTAMESYTHTETANPNVGAQAPPETINLRVLKTRHGIVQGRTTVGGKPVAIVLSRPTYGHEVESAVGFARLQNPNYVHDATSFQHAADGIDYTFNWFYTDDKDIAYYGSARLPKRAAGYDWDLPRWGDKAYDDKGFLPFASHPRVINPSQGYLVSWNNKQAPGFSAADNQWGYGAVYRSLALEDRIKSRIAGGKKVTRPQLVEAMIDGGTVDIRAAYLLPSVLAVLGTPTDANDAAAVAALKAWVAAGSHRVDRARTGAYPHQAAVALLDGWWDPSGAGVAGTASLPRDVLRPTLGQLVDVLPQGIDDHPRQGIGSSFNGIAWYGYVSKDLRQALGKTVQGRYSRTYCGTLAACRTALRASLHSAVAAVLADQSKTTVGALTYDKSLDFIRSVTAGVVGSRPIDWQNRPTFQQAVKLTTHRPRAVTVVAGPPAAPGPTLPTTGLLTTAPLVALLALGGALFLRRRRTA